MFDGNVKKRPAVSLRGKSKKEEKAEFLQRAAADRAKRAQERIQNAASVQIQRVWRGRHAAWKFRASEIADLAAKLTDLGKVAALLGPAGFRPPAPVLLALAARAAAVLRPADPEAAGAAGALCPLVAAALRPDAPAGAALGPLLREPAAAAAAEEEEEEEAAAAAGAEVGAAWRAVLGLTRLAVAVLLRQTQAAGAAGAAAAAAAGGGDGAAAAPAGAGPLLSLLAPEVLGALAAAAPARAAAALAALVAPAPAPASPRVVAAGRFTTLPALLTAYWGLEGESAEAGEAVLWAACARAAAARGEPGHPAPADAAAARRALAAAALGAPGLVAAAGPRGRRARALGGAAWAAAVDALAAGGGGGGARSDGWPAAASPAEAAAALQNVLALLRLPAPEGLPFSAAAAGLLHRLVARLPPGAEDEEEEDGGGGSAAAAVAAAGKEAEGRVDDGFDSSEEEEDAEAGAGGGGGGGGEETTTLDALLRTALRRHARGQQQRRQQQQQQQQGAGAGAGAALRALLEPGLMAGLFDAVLGGPADGGAAAAAAGAGGGGGGGDPALGLCGLYADLLMRGGAAAAAAAAGGGGGARARALNTLALAWPQAPIAQRLWAHLSSRHDLLALARGGGLLPGGGGGGGGGEGEGEGEGGQAAAVGRALYLFLAVYGHQLLALSDAEFFERGGWPLGHGEVAALVELLGTLLARALWLDPAIWGGGAAPAAVHLVRAAALCFNRLHERALRRPSSTWLPRGAWAWPFLEDRHLLPPPEMGALGEEDPLQWDAVYSTGRVAFLLNTVPQVVPFAKRVQIFRRLLRGEQARARQREAAASGADPSDPFGALQLQMAGGRGAAVRIRRPFLYEDAYAALGRLGDRLKGRVQVTFENEHGMEEAGIDGGGVFKEFLDALTKRTFDPSYGLFQANAEGLLSPAPGARLACDHPRAHFEFAGRVLGKAVLEDILVEPQFANFFLNMLLGKHNQYDDLFSLDPEMYKHLNSLKDVAAAGEDISALHLTFSVTHSEYGEVRTVNLCPDGDNIPVTNENVIRYIHLLANYKLNVQTAAQGRAFLKGFRDLIPVAWIRLFTPQELQAVIGGEPRRLDTADLRRHVHYAGGYHGSQPYIQAFWEIIDSFTAEEQAAFLKFVTSCSRQPLLGFQHLHPTFSIQQVPAGEGDARLPSSGTCMNLLKLPRYAGGPVTLRQKLLYAIRANAGFELS